jgi:hypothetical protein
LATIMLAKVKNIEVSAGAEISELSPLLAGIPKTTPYAVPSSYFENTLEDISGLTKESDSPMLNAIGKNTPFSVPEGYFENLPVDPLFGRTWMRVASAAAIAGALFLGGYQLLRDNSKELPSTAATQNESIDQNLLASNTQPIEKDIREASTKELEDFIATVQANPESTTENIKSTSDRTEVEELLKDVSTKEMESFLSAMPMTDDDFLTTN